MSHAIQKKALLENLRICLFSPLFRDIKLGSYNDEFSGDLAYMFMGFCYVWSINTAYNEVTYFRRPTYY